MLLYSGIGIQWMLGQNGQMFILWRRWAIGCGCWGKGCNFGGSLQVRQFLRGWRHLMAGVSGHKSFTQRRSGQHITCLPHSLRPPKSNVWNSVHEYTMWMGWTWKLIISQIDCETQIGLINSVLFQLIRVRLKQKEPFSSPVQSFHINLTPWRGRTQGQHSTSRLSFKNVSLGVTSWVMQQHKIILPTLIKWTKIVFKWRERKNNPS